MLSTILQHIALEIILLKKKINKNKFFKQMAKRLSQRNNFSIYVFNK